MVQTTFTLLMQVKLLMAKLQVLAEAIQATRQLCIGTDGRWYVGYISNPGGQGVSYSDDQGESWTTKIVAPNPGQLADKNHMWLDRKVGSPYENYLYDAWTPFGGGNNGYIVLSRSTDRAETWSTPMNISSPVGGFHQGVNLNCGPNGEVYAIWACNLWWRR